MMAGPPGSGKTTLALELSRLLGWPTVDKDTLKSPMLESGIPEEIAGRASYELMFEVGRDLLIRQGFSVILDSPAGYPTVIERAHALAGKAGAGLRFVLCLADAPLRNARLAGRTARPSQWSADTGTLDDGTERWGALLPPDALRIHTDVPRSELIPQILRYLQVPDRHSEGSPA